MRLAPRRRRKPLAGPPPRNSQTVSYGLPVAVDPDLRENDRSATGFLPPAAFEEAGDAFFAEPEKSVQGWERAVDAQARVTAAFERIVAGHADGNLALIAHGGVGALLLCGLASLPIARAHDQPFQGHYWAASLADRRVLHPWRPIAPR